MRVLVPSPLLSYTGKREVEAEGRSVDELLTDLDRQYKGLRFRMVDEQGALRPHVRLFVNGESVRDLKTGLSAADEVQIVQALSGG